MENWGEMFIYLWGRKGVLSYGKGRKRRTTSVCQRRKRGPRPSHANRTGGVYQGLNNSLGLQGASKAGSWGSQLGGIVDMNLRRTEKGPSPRGGRKKKLDFSQEPPLKPFK